MDYYLILGINWDATAEEIKEAYRKMAQKYHPDHYAGESNPFLQIQEAYHILSDPEQRKKYDRRYTGRNVSSSPIRSARNQDLTSEPEPLIPSKGNPPLRNMSLIDSFETFTPSFEELFDRFWRNFTSMNSPKSEVAENLEVEVTINPEQAKRGGQLQLRIPVKIVCPLCHGTGSAGFWSCLRCDGHGSVKTELSLLVPYPGKIKNQYTKSISLQAYGIGNFYLTVTIRLSGNAG